MGALCDDELLAVLLWLDAHALEAAERVCRRWRRLALSPTVCRAHRPRARVWDGAGDRAAVVAERTAERNWLAGRYARNTLPWPHEWGAVETQLDGPRLAVFHAGTAALFDARTLAPVWRVELPGPCCPAAAENARLAVFVEVHGDNVVHLVDAAGTLHATQVRLRDRPEFTMWRGRHVAYGVYDDDECTVTRMDAASGRVTRSLPLPPATVRLPEIRCATALADDVGIGIITWKHLVLDDGRSAAPALLRMRHSGAWILHACTHPDGRTIAALSDTGGLQTVRLWDMRALGRPRAEIALDPGPLSASFYGPQLSFGRDVVRISTAQYVTQFDLSTGQPLAVRWGFEPVRFGCLQSVSEAFATVVCEKGPLSAELNLCGTEITVYLFDGAYRQPQ